VSALGARVWPWVPVGLLVGMLGGLGSMAVIAIRDPGFSLERDYYKKGVDYELEIRQRAENARLGWSTAVELGAARPDAETSLTVRLSDERGAISGARGAVEALRNATASRVLEASLEEVAPGTYRTKLPLRRGGLWELRLSFEREQDRVTAVVRRDVQESTP
jgi:hypothetical protein